MSGARERASQQSSPPLELLVAVSDLVSVVKREAAQAQLSLSYPSSPGTATSSQSLPMLCSISEPVSPTAANLPADSALWLPCTVVAVLDYIESQAPGLLHPCVADLLLEAACTLRCAPLMLCVQCSVFFTWMNPINWVGSCTGTSPRDLNSR